MNECNMTVHRDYANKSCPGDYLYERHGAIAAEVNKRLGVEEPHTDLQPPTSVPVTTDTSITLAFAKGDTVEFTGSKHYTSSKSTNGKSCKPGKAQVTNVAKAGKHPCHLVRVQGGGSTVYGWVDAADIKAEGTAAITTVNNEILRQALSEATDAVYAAVTYTSQTYVDTLKKEGTFDKEAQMVALNTALTKAQSLLAFETKELLESLYGDLQDWLVTKIEKTVKETKLIA